MPAGSMPSWAQTSSSAAIFGGGSKTNGRTAVKPEPATDQPVNPTLAQQPNHTATTSPSHNAVAQPSSAAHEKPYKPKRKQKSVTHCPPLTSVASSSRAHYAVPHIDEPSSDDALSQLIAVQAKRAGFDASTASALHHVRQLTKKFLTSVYTAATHAAELSSRDHPSARDLVYALETHGQPIRELRHFHRQQESDAEHQDDTIQTSAKARGKARQYAQVPQTYRASIGGRKRRPRDGHTVNGDSTSAVTSEHFLPSDSDDGSELETWSVSSNSDDEHPNRRSAIQARVAKRKYDLTRILAKKQRRHAKLQQAPSMQQSTAATSSTSARDLRALTSGEQAWRRVADHIVPRHLPGMPPRHAWMQTPAFPTKAYGSSLGVADVEDDDAATARTKKDPLMLVNRKLANARLVETSLRRLIQNTDIAAASAYASTADAAIEKVGHPPNAASTTSVVPEKEAAAPPPSSSGFVVPKVPSSSASGLTLRLKNKISLPTSALNSPSQPTTPVVSRRLATTPFGGSASATGLPGTPLGMGMSMSWGGEPLMSPLTPVTATALGGPMTPYPPTPRGIYGHYFSSNPGAAPTGSPGGGYRSRSQSVVAANLDSNDGDANAGQDKLGVRVPGPVNYKNVWYAPGSTIASGGLSGGAASTAKTNAGHGNHPRSVKRMRKWKV